MDVCSKRKTAGFVPYRMGGHSIEFYLQKKTADAPFGSGQYHLFGGGLEDGETPEQALLREIEEELRITPKNYKYLGDVDTESAVVSVFYAQVAPDFESKVQVMEGEYGRFLSLPEALATASVPEGTRAILQAVAKKVAA